MRKTTFEITIKVTTMSSAPLDENSIKAVINDTQTKCFRSASRNLTAIDETEPGSIMVSVSKFKMNRKHIALSTFGT